MDGSVSYYDLILVSNEGKRSHWLESEMKKYLPSLATIHKRKFNERIRLGLEVPFSHETIEFFLFVAKDKPLTKYTWMDLELILKEISLREEPEFNTYRNVIISHFLSGITVDNCIGIWKLSHLVHSSKETEVKRFVVNCLVTAVLEKTIDVQFFRLPESLLFLLLTDNELRMSTEADVIDLITSWIDAMPNERSESLPRLLTTIRKDGLPSKITEVRGIRMDTIPDSKLPARTLRERILVLGGWSNGPRDVIELYDQVNNKWMKVNTQMPYKAAYHGAVAMNGDIYVFGGGDDTNNYYATVSKLNRSMRWETVAPLSTPRLYITNTCCVLNGMIYVMGGFGGTTRQANVTRNERLRSVERYNADLNQWENMEPMRQGRSDAAAAVANGKIYVAGGFSGTAILSSVEVYDPVNNSWTDLPNNMPNTRAGLALLFDGTFLLAIGGFDGEARSRSVWKYEVENPEARWIQAPARMKTERSNFSACWLDDKIVVAGGYSTGIVGSVEMFDGNEWKELANLSFNRSALCTLQLDPDHADNIKKNATAQNH